MRLFALVTFALLTGLPAWSQVEPSATGGTTGPGNDTRMLLPPPVSGTVYPNEVGSDTRTNYVSGQFAFTGAYYDNVYAGDLAKPLGAEVFTILPSLIYDRTTPRQTQTLTYSPGFTFYQPTSELDSINQEARAQYEYRFTPYTAIKFSDDFLQTSDTFGVPGAFSGGGVSGAPGNPAQTIIVPYAQILSNTVRGSFEKQFARNDMFGGGGSFAYMDYPSQSQTPDLSASKTEGGTAFYSRRISHLDYLGATYDYSRISSNSDLGEGLVQTHALIPFVTFYFNRTMSVSAGAGPQHYSGTQVGVLSSSAWTPAISASVGLQASHANFAASYLRGVTAGDGLIGTFFSNTGDLSAQWQIAHSWVTGASFDYAILKNVAPTLSTAEPGGHRITGNIFLRKSLGDHFGTEVGYHRLHQSYTGIAVLANNPDNDGVYLTVSYHFQKPIGR